MLASLVLSAGLLWVGWKTYLLVSGAMTVEALSETQLLDGMAMSDDWRSEHEWRTGRTS